MRVSATQLESYRLFMQPEQDWMPESDLIDSIKGAWTPNRKVEIGPAFGAILEDPDRYLVPGGFEAKGYGFDRDVIEPCLALIDRRGIFEAKAVKSYGSVDVASKADHILGSHLSEFKTTHSTFSFEKYADSYQWRFMADALKPSRITYHVFVLDEDDHNGVIRLKDIHSFDLYPYAALHDDCRRLVEEFTGYVVARGLDGYLLARQKAAEAAA